MNTSEIARTDSREVSGIVGAVREMSLSTGGVIELQSWHTEISGLAGLLVQIADIIVLRIETLLLFGLLLLVNLDVHHVFSHVLVLNACHIVVNQAIPKSSLSSRGGLRSISL